jgi:hypothetical protein
MSANRDTFGVDLYRRTLMTLAIISHHLDPNATLTFEFPPNLRSVSRAQRRKTRYRESDGDLFAEKSVSLSRMRKTRVERFDALSAKRCYKLCHIFNIYIYIYIYIYVYTFWKIVITFNEFEETSSSRLAISVRLIAILLFRNFVKVILILE